MTTLSNINYFKELPFSKYLLKTKDKMFKKC